VDQPHLQVVTTHGVAIRIGQGRVHIPVRSLHPWHRVSENIKCPDCDTSYTVSGGFPKADVDDVLRRQHTKKEQHPDVISSTPGFTRIEDCDCERIEATKGNG
jgi:hypothetical protein